MIIAIIIIAVIIISFALENERAADGGYITFNKDGTEWYNSANGSYGTINKNNINNKVVLNNMSVNTSVNKNPFNVGNKTNTANKYRIGDAYIYTDKSESSADRFKCTYLLSDNIVEGDMVMLHTKDGGYRLNWYGSAPLRTAIRNVRYGELPCAYEDMCWAEETRW